MQKTVQHQSLLLTHPLCSHPLSYFCTLIYIPSPFLKNYPFPHLLYYFPLPCPSSHFNRFHLRACESDCGKDGGVGGENEKLEYIEEGKGEKKRRCSSRNEPTCFLCFVLTSLRWPYICTYTSAGCGPCSYHFFFPFLFIPPSPIFHHSSSSV